MGGQGVVVLEGSKPLVRQGIEVSVLSPRRGPFTQWRKLPREEVVEGIKVLRVETQERPQRFLGYKAPPPILDPAGFFQALLPIWRADIVHFHNFWYGGFSLPLLVTARAMRKKIIFTPHYEDFAKVNPRDSASSYRFLEILSDSAWRTQVISEREKWMLLEFTDRLTKVPLGIDLGQIQGARREARYPADSPPTILTVGNACERKNYLMLIEALGRIDRPWRLVVKSSAGADKNYSLLCRARAEQLGLGDRVEWRTDFMSRSQLSSLYETAALFVMPSLWEAFSLSALEAMARGVPAVLSDGCMITEYFEPGSEVLVAGARDTAAWAGAIEMLLSHPERARDMADAALKKISGYFTWDRVAGDSLALYRAALADTPLEGAWKTIDPGQLSSLIRAGHDEEQLCNGWLTSESDGEFTMSGRASFLINVEGKSRIVVSAGTRDRDCEAALQLSLDKTPIGETPLLSAEIREYSFELPRPGRAVRCGVLRAQLPGRGRPRIKLREIEAR